jgi:hypothetical protein
MPIWRTPPVTEQAGLTLRNWRVIQLADGTQHLAGYCIENREGRVSSVVREIDYEKLIAKLRLVGCTSCRGGPVPIQMQSTSGGGGLL